MPNTATLDEWTGDGWREIPLESYAACALSLYVPITVAPGESATVTTGAHPPRGGRYRIRIATTRGEAISTAVEVH